MMKLLDWSNTSLRCMIMETIGAYQAKTHLPKLLERVIKGERFIITKHGMPVAILQPAESFKKADPKLKWISFFLDEMAITFNLSS